MDLGIASLCSFLQDGSLVSKACVAGTYLALLRLTILNEHLTLLQGS